MNKVIQVAPREALLSLDALYGLAVFLGTLPMSRRKVLDWLADVIFGWIEDGGVILDGEGIEIEIHDTIIDDAHGSDGGRGISEMRARAVNRPQRRGRQSIWLRMALYDAASRIVTGRSIIDFAKEEEA